MEPNDGGNFDLRLLDFDWLGLPEQEIDERRKREVVFARNLVRMTAETLTGYKESRWILASLPVFPEHLIRELADKYEEKNREFRTDYSLAELIKDGVGLRDLCNGQVDGDEQEDVYAKIEEWEARGERELWKYFSLSIAASFRSEGDGKAKDTGVRRAVLVKQIDFLKKLAK